MLCCPDDAVLVDLVEKGLPPVVGAEVRGHLDRCDPCHETVALLMRDRRSSPAVAVTTARLDLVTGMPPTSWPALPAARAGQRTLEPGTVFARRFEIEHAAGSGGFGTVYRARDQRTGDRVALKIVPLGGVRERFDREAELLADLRHPGIVGYVAHGRTPDGDGFLAMEWLDGFDLATRLRCGPLTLGETVLLFRRVVDALVPAHERGIVHRDVKPSNLFLPACALENLKLLDFGVARRSAGAALTGSDAVVGTPGYMAPEQLRGEPELTASADVFSLGCVLYESLTGRAPFAADQLAAALVKVLFDDPPPLAKLRPDVPARLVDLVERMLRKRPEERPADARALAQELDGLALDIAPRVAPAPLPPPRVSSAGLGLFSVAVARAAAAPAELRASLAAMGADVELRADGTFVAVVRRTGSAVDQAVVADRLGLALATALPGGRVAVATGRGALQPQLTGEVMERAEALLEHAPGAGVFSDELTRALAAGRGAAAAFVGRERELAWLESTLAGCIDEGGSSAVGIVAPPGMGKSRLARELERRARLQHPDLKVIRGSAATAPYLAARAADGDPRILHDQIGAAFVRWVRAECAAAPCLILVEDLHAADPFSVELFERLLREAREARFLLVATARPEVQGLFPSFWTSELLHELPLRRLNPRAAERLVAELAGEAPLGAAAVARIVELSAGHPYLLEELVGAAAAGEAAVPATVLAMHQARIGQLPPLSRRVLRAGSLFGRAFAQAGVRARLGEEVTTPALELTLDSLVRRDLLERTDAPGGYRFREALVGEAAHGLLTDEERALGRAS